MIKIINIYFAKQVYTMLLIVSLVLMAIETSLTFVNEVTYFSKGLPTSEILKYVFWSTPIRFLDLFPVAVLIAVLVSLGKFVANSEIVVLMAAGQSKFRVVQRLLAPVLGIVIAFYGTMELSIGFFYEKTEAIKPMPTIFVSDGSWHKEKDTIFFVDRFDDSDSINQLAIFKLGTGEFKQQVNANSAHQVDGGWMLDDAQVINFSDELNRFSVDELFWPITIDAQLLSRLSSNPERISVFELWLAIDYLRAQRIDTKSLEQVLWRRISAPGLTLMMAFLGALMVFANPRQASTSSRVFAGIVIGVSLRLLQEVAKPMVAVFDLPPWLVALMPLMLVASVVVLQLLWQQRLNLVVLYQKLRLRPSIMPSMFTRRK